MDTQPDVLFTGPSGGPLRTYNYTSMLTKKWNLQKRNLQKVKTKYCHCCANRMFDNGKNCWFILNDRQSNFTSNSAANWED